MTSQTKKEAYIKSDKQAATIKVRTVVIAMLWIASLVAVGFGGWVLRSEDQARVQTEASALVNKLKANQ